jgi:uncharacterized SAM-binding protein YcdF (DUF218 family)
MVCSFAAWRTAWFRPLFFSALLLLYLFTTPVLTRLMWSWMPIPPTIELEEQTTASAIVVLGASRYSNAPEYGGDDDLAGLGLERIRYGAWLQNRIALPILTSGRGFRAPGERSEARIMRDILQQEFGACVPWMEERSLNTYQNALYSAELLASLGMRHIVLVTQAYHMPRAVEAFRSTGLLVTPAPTRYFVNYDAEFMVLDWLPSNIALTRNSLLLHEMVGRLWYHYRYY